MSPLAPVLLVLGALAAGALVGRRRLVARAGIAPVTPPLAPSSPAAPAPRPASAPPPVASFLPVSPDRDCRGILLAAVQSGAAEIPAWVWVAIPSWGIDVRVQCDAVKCRLGDISGVRVPVAFGEMRSAGKLLGILPPTPAMVDAVWDTVSAHVKPIGLVRTAEDSAKMNTAGFAQRYHADLETKLAAAGLVSGQLVEPVGKWWVFDEEALLRSQARFGDRAAALYGAWNGTRERPMQPVSGVHDDGHSDYSTVCRGVSVWARRGTESVWLPDLYRECMPRVAHLVDLWHGGAPSAPPDLVS